MKKIYPLSIAIVAFVILLFQGNNLSAQSGNSCATAVAVTPADSCNFSAFTTTDSVYYFSFTATSSCAQIIVVSSATRCAPGAHPHRLTLFGGTCSALQWLEDEFLPDIAGCQELDIDASNLTANNTYYIRVSRQIKDTGCVATPTPGAVCTPAAPLSFQLCIRSFDIFIPLDFGLELPALSHSYYTNKGQILDVNGNPRFDIRNYTNNSSPAVYCTDTAVSFVFARIDTLASTADTLHRVDLVLTGANVQPPQRAFKTEKTSGYLNYFLGHVPTGVTNVKGYSRPVWKNVYPNIDMQFYSNSEGVKFYFVRNPGGNPNDIELQFNGATAVNVTPSGGLDIVTTLGTISFEAGHAYAINPSGNIVPMPWQAKFVQVNTNTVKFDIHQFPQWMPLIIQVDRGHSTSSPTPYNNLWSTYLQGDGTCEAGYGLAKDNVGNIYVTGSTMSYNFPTTAGVVQTTLGGQQDAYALKFGQIGDLIFGTFLGGNWTDLGRDIAVDNAGNIFVYGYTSSDDFPVEDAGTYFNGTNTIGETDAFIVKLNPNMQGPLLWSTYYGGTSDENPTRIAIDGANNIYVTGSTSSSDFPVLSHIINPTAYNQLANKGNDEGFISQFDNNGVQIWSTYFGGNSFDLIRDIAIDANNNVYCTGVTLTSLSGTPVCGVPTNSGFPLCNALGGYYQSTFGGGGWDAFITRFTSMGDITWSTYFGGNGDEDSHAITITPSGKIYITGQTSTTNGNSNPNACGVPPLGEFPTCDPGGTYLINSNAGQGDLFISCFDAGNNLAWSTFYGSPNAEISYAITSDNANNIYIGGMTRGNGFPTWDPGNNFYFVSTNADPTLTTFDPFVLRITPAFQPDWGTYYGGSGPTPTFCSDESVYDMIATMNDKLYITGSTNSLNFPYRCIPSLQYCFQVINQSELQDIYMVMFDLTGNNQISVQENTIDKPNALFIYPNPSSSLVNICFVAEKREDLFITIYNSVGQTISTEKRKNSIGLQKVTMNVSNLSDGIYFIVCYSGDKIYYNKFIIK